MVKVQSNSRPKYSYPKRHIYKLTSMCGCNMGIIQAAISKIRCGKGFLIRCADLHIEVTEVEK